MFETVIYPLLRHGLQWFGAYLVATNYASDATIEVIIGAALSLSVVLWSICKKKGLSLCQH